MTWNPTPKEIESVCRLDDSKRYTYLIKKVADQEMLWGLRDDTGWAVAADPSGREVFPIWPHEHYAALSAIGEWSNRKPSAIKLDDWLSKWLPGLERDNRLIAVFPSAQTRGVVVEPARMAEDIRLELENY
jgi:hypothetical protein